MNELDNYFEIIEINCTFALRFEHKNGFITQSAKAEVIWPRSSIRRGGSILAS